MSQKRLAKLTRMSRSELQWRANTAIRNAVQRARARVSQPGWDPGDLADRLADGSRTESIRRALNAGDWSEAHARLAESITEHPAHFAIAPSMREALSARIRADFPGAARDAASRADRVVDGEFDLLGYKALRFDAADGSTDWHLDPVHDRRAPRAFWSTVPFLDPRCGDHKIIWELNRQQHLLVLGRAFWLTGDERYRDVAIEHLLSWIQANPPLTGINWASMLELGFRTLSWVWAVNFFVREPTDQQEQPWLVDALLALDRQLSHIEQNLSYYFSPNTHLLGEALALYVAGRSMPVLAGSNRFADIGRRVLVEQIDRQMARDGGHLERSTHYHRYTLDFYILALVVARITADPVAHAFESAVARLAFAARLLADNRGRLPHFGDDDGGSLVPLCGRALDDVRDSLAEASALVGRPDLRIGDFPEEAHWMLAHPLLHPILEQSRGVPATDAIGSAALPDTGYYVSRSPAGDHLVVDAGAHGYENGGHAHADALSLTLSVRGVPLLIDPGTGSYTTDPEMRDTFRSSLLHNTVVVDGQSQSVPSGPFHWSHTAHAQAHVWRTNPGFDYLEASHDGYAPLEQRRHVLSLHGDLLIVADLVTGGGSHDVQVHWHLDPRWTVDVAGRRALLRTAGERVEFAVSRGLVEQVSASAAPGIGWHAPVYGRLEPTSAIRVSDSGATPLWIVTVFGMNPANEVLVVEPVPIWAPAGALERGIGVKISRTHSVDLFGVAERTQQSPKQHPFPATDQTWRLAGYETDARMFFARSSESIARLALVDGSLVRSADRHSLYVQLPRETPDLHLDFARPRGTLGAAARIGGQAFGAHVQLGGRELPIAVERRSLPRARARRALVNR